MFRTRVGIVASVVWILVCAAVRADVSVRECITPTDPGTAYLLPPSSGWTVLSTLQFNHDTTSDYVANVMVSVTEGNTPNTLVEYQIILDGVSKGWFTRRVPDRFRDTQILRALIRDVPGGIHTLGVQARNLSPSVNIYFGGVWISPLLLDGAETTVGTPQTTPVTVGTAWTTLHAIDVPTLAGRMNFLAAYTSVTGGSALAGLEYRILRGATEIERFVDSMPDVFTDGMHFAFIDTAPVAGTNTYSLQARILSGSPATFASRSLQAQSMPRFTVFEATAPGPIAVSSSWQDVLATPYQQISAISRGPNGTDGSGFANVTYAGNFNYAAALRFKLDVQDPTGVDFEVGVLETHPVGQRHLVANLSDWEQLGGLVATGNFRIVLEARTFCSQPGATLTLERARFQIAVIPDSNPYTHYSCAKSSRSCCANNYPSCLVYACGWSSSLQLVSVPAWNCQ